MPVRVKLSLTDDCARWSGDLAVDDVANAWSGDAPPLQLAVAADPDSLGCPLAHAVARLTIHAPRARLMLDVARWRPFLEALSTNSPSAGDLVLPELRAAGGDASILAATISTPEVLAGRLNRAMDNCMLARIDLHLRRYLEHGDDPGRAVSFAAAADLRAAMLPLWDDWRDAFLGDPGLLARFLRLAACAKDHPSAAGEGATLVGPRLATPLIRACAVALAVATGWRVIAPRLAVPGNLARENEGAASTGHACAAGYIDGEKMALAAVRHMWTTEFVLLPMEAMPVSVLVGTNTPLTRGGGGVPLLDDVDVGDKLMLTVDRRFQDAAQSGAADLAALLTDIEEDHFARLKAAINAAGEEGALG